MSDTIFHKEMFRGLVEDLIEAGMNIEEALATARDSWQLSDKDFEEMEQFIIEIHGEL